jgi:hypothetical protein
VGRTNKATHATVIEHTVKVEGSGHKLYTENFFFPLAIFNDLKKKMNCCRTVRPRRKRMLEDLGHNKTKLKWGDI